MKAESTIRREMRLLEKIAKSVANITLQFAAQDAAEALRWVLTNEATKPSSWLPREKP